MRGAHTGQRYHRLTKEKTVLWVQELRKNTAYRSRSAMAVFDKVIGQLRKSQPQLSPGDIKKITASFQNALFVGLIYDPEEAIRVAAGDIPDIFAATGILGLFWNACEPVSSAEPGHGVPPL